MADGVRKDEEFSGTKPVEERHRIDELSLDRWMREHVEGYAGPLTVLQFKGGQSNPTYRLDTSGRSYVMRRRPFGKLLPSAHAVDREFKVIEALSKQGFPVAEPMLYCEDERIVGTAFYLMGFVEGRVIWEPHIPATDPHERAAVYDAMNFTLARLHSFDPVVLGLADFGRGENYVARQIERWSKQYQASQTEEIGEMEELAAWLPRHLPPPAPIRLVHGDYRLDNIILALGRPTILAVLDWELSTLGDPLADLTYHLMQWDMPPSETGAGVGSLLGHDLGRLGIPSRSAYVDAYVARTGLDPRPHLPFYLAYNFFRLAAILQGIVGRVRDGTATSEKALAMAPQRTEEGFLVPRVIAEGA